LTARGSGPRIRFPSQRGSRYREVTVKFPGSKLLHHWDLAAQTIPLEDLLRSCQQVGLTGFAEVQFPEAVAMIFYYLGGEVNALYREGPVAFHGQDALERLRAHGNSPEGSVSVYELPLDVAHLLRGITNRQKLKESLTDRRDLTELLQRMEKVEHTGTLEIQSTAGAAMVLVIRGRVSNIYWESAEGLTFEKGEARRRLEEALGKTDGTHVYLAEFSREVWKSRHEVQDSVRSRLERHEDDGPRTAPEQAAAEEMSLRNQILEELCAELPSVVQAFLFDLLTGGIICRKSGRGTSALRVGLIAEKIPAITLYLRDLVAAEEHDDVELVEVSTERVAVLVALVPETQEAIAVAAERAQPTALIAATLSRFVRSYAARVAERGLITHKTEE
jgi:hypothetical protein